METMTENIWQKIATPEATASIDGRLVFDKDRSRYLHKGFWAGMYEEVRDLKFTLQKEPQSQGDMFLFSYNHKGSRPTLAHPSVSEGDFWFSALRKRSIHSSRSSTSRHCNSN